eukprot:scaffold156179_cov16-Tisochrysis_lutea.AAC.1
MPNMGVILLDTNPADAPEFHNMLIPVVLVIIKSCSLSSALLLADSRAPPKTARASSQQVVAWALRRILGSTCRLGGAAGGLGYTGDELAG